MTHDTNTRGITFASSTLETKVHSPGTQTADVRVAWAAAESVVPEDTR